MEFRTGTVWPGGIAVDDPGRFLATAARTTRDIENSLLVNLLDDLGVDPATAGQVLSDVRLVRFADDGETVVYHGTYRAYDSDHVAPHLLTTQDLQTYRRCPPTGPAARNKGMALFSAVPAADI